MSVVNKEVIVLVTTGVADDHQEDGESAVDLVPEHGAAEQQTVDGAVAPADVGAPPLGGSGPGGDLRRNRQAGALLAGRVTLTRSARRGQSEEGSIAA